jgi:choline dehydrogenase-like flavoprotein
MTKHFDAITIGTGQAGPFLAHRLAAAGMKVAIVERKLFGGTCVNTNTGCIPAKAVGGERLRCSHGVPRPAFRRSDRWRDGCRYASGQVKKDVISGKIEDWNRAVAARA